MADLEDQIELLTRLDTLRMRSASLRDEGCDALLSNTKWESAGDLVEDALVVRALCRRGASPTVSASFDKLVEILECVELRDVTNEERDQVPILRAARVMQALVATPESAFRQSAFFSYYWIIRELYSADAPDWSAGGARAGNAGSATAFVTGECVRALLGFVRALHNTGTLVGGIGDLVEERDRLSRAVVPQKWLAIESRRLDWHFWTTIKSLSGNICLQLDLPDRVDDLDVYLRTFSERLRSAVELAVATFRGAQHSIRRLRQNERAATSRSPDPEPAARRFERSASGHLIAYRAIKKAVHNAEQARDSLPRRGNVVVGELIEACRGLRRQFDEAADEVRKLLRPAQNYISAVLDRELAAAAASGLNCDAAELAFAAASFGAVSRSWEDERLPRATAYLSGAISEGGVFHAGRPIHSKEKGYKLNVFGGEILRAMAQLLQHVKSAPVEPRLVERVMRFFEETKGLNPKVTVGWFHEGPQLPIRPDRSVTAVAVLALERINRMLDERINDLVFGHFSVRQADELRKGPNLQTLFYPDYGLENMPGRGALARPSVAFSLARMRAHVARVSIRESGRALYSMVLHGPGGTGKTTLVEALAASCGVPLVEVTPSDIVVGGEEAVERRTRAVFRALSMLTRAVISFDEFEPVLWHRDPAASTPRSVFAFLTPGMLPKLKALNKALLQ